MQTTSDDGAVKEMKRKRLDEEAMQQGDNVDFM